jgi:putative NADH-flavin reductase
MNITVIGAAGNVGRRVVAEALARDHRVRAVVRSSARASEVPVGAEVRVGDAGRAEDVARLSAGQDVVVSATRPAPGHEGDLVAMAQAVLAGVARTSVRLLLVGGAGSLTVPGSGGTLVIDHPRYLEAPFRAIAQACTDMLEVCRAEPAVDWAYLSPAAMLVPGERRGDYRLGGDELVVDGGGDSVISMEDLAVALLDEAERPKHHRMRFTVGY